MPVVINQPNSIGHNELVKRHTTIEGFASATGGGGYMSHLQPLANCDRVLIKQRVDLLEVILGCETENRYDILNEENQAIYSVDETSDFCCRCWCGPLRPIYVSFRDHDKNTVIYLHRPLACQEFCFPCCLQSMRIESPKGNVIGTVHQKWGMRPIIHIRDQSNNLVFVVKGPYCQFSCRCGDVDFPIFASDGVSECGRISKQWRGVVTEKFTDADIFGVQFPPGINTQLKVLLIGASLLVDYMYFESSNQ